MEGGGNDFLVIDNRFYRFSPEALSDLARRWCARRYGVGADGLLAFEEDTGEADADGAGGESGGAVDFRMRYVNADGSWASMCGNGARCLARYARDAGMNAPTLAFRTDAGVYHAHVPDAADADETDADAADANAMDADTTDAAKPPVRLYVPDPERLQTPVALDGALPGELAAVHFVWTGTEHLVAFVDAVDAVPVDAWGRALRTDAAVAPAGANVNFVSVDAADAADGAARLRVRTYEKGVEAETLACGTGILASAVVAWQVRDDVAADRPVAVQTPGGSFGVGYDETPRGRALYLDGPARTVFRGTIRVQP